MTKDAKLRLNNFAFLLEIPMPSITRCLVLLTSLNLVPLQCAESVAGMPRSPLSGDQVVQKMAGMNLQRAQTLKNYQSTRVYRLQYRGFPGARSAEMVVAVKYEAPGTKEFTIQSATGSKLIIE